MADEFCLKMPDFQVTFRDLLHCRKSTTRDKRLYFTSEGRRAEDFFALKNPTASAGFEPAILGTKGQHATSRPPVWWTDLAYLSNCSLQCYYAASSTNNQNDCSSHLLRVESLKLSLLRTNRTKIGYSGITNTLQARVIAVDIRHDIPCEWIKLNYTETANYL